VVADGDPARLEELRRFATARGLGLIAANLDAVLGERGEVAFAS
jgi:hypothetical protein